VRGAAAACERAGCVLLGGETAEMPGLYPPGDFDLAGFAVGLVDRAHAPSREALVEGDVVIGLPSSGLHSNGYSLARRALTDGGVWLSETPDGWPKSVGETLLVPTEIYVPKVLALSRAAQTKAHAHVTGGGLFGRLRAMLPPGVVLELDSREAVPPPVFGLIARAGKIQRDEMYRTFNMGIGYAVALSPKAAEQALSLQAGWRRLGTIVRDSAQSAADLHGRIEWLHG
jgi:phosphoribosylformylglycinamidine cyclo-ligase